MWWHFPMSDLQVQWQIEKWMKCRWQAICHLSSMSAPWLHVLPPPQPLLTASMSESVSNKMLIQARLYWGHYWPKPLASPIPPTWLSCQGYLPHPFWFIDKIVGIFTSSKIECKFSFYTVIKSAINKLFLRSLIISGCSGKLLGWLLRREVFLGLQCPKWQISNSWGVNAYVSLFDCVAFEGFSEVV